MMSVKPHTYVSDPNEHYEHICSECGLPPSDPIHLDAEPSAPLREATEDEDRLIQSLSVSVGHRLLRDWQDLPEELRVLPMNRAFLSAMAHAMGKFLGAVAVNDEENLEGWNILVAQTLEMARQTAVEARDMTIAAMARAGEDSTPPLRRRALVPEPKSIM